MPASLHFGLSVISRWYWGWHYKTVKLSLEHAWQQIYLPLISGYEADWWSLSCSIKNSWSKFSCHYYFNADLALPVPNFPAAVYPQNHELLQYLVHWWLRRLDGWIVQKKINVTEVFSPVLLILRSRERFEAVIFCVNAPATNQNLICSILKEIHAIPVVRVS